MNVDANGRAIDVGHRTCMAANIDGQHGCQASLEKITTHRKPPESLFILRLWDPPFNRGRKPVLAWRR